MVKVLLPPTNSGAFIAPDMKTRKQNKMDTKTFELSKEDIRSLKEGNSLKIWALLQTHNVNPILQKWIDELPE